MIIAGFGDTVASMYTFPTAMMDDDHRVARPGALKTVPLSSGVLDVRGNGRNRRAAQIVGKSFILTQDPQPVYTADNDLNASSSTHTDTLSHTNIKPGSVIIQDSGGAGTDDGLGQLYDSSAAPRATINYGTGVYTVFEDFFLPVYSFDYEYRSSFTDPWVTLGAAVDALRLATIAADESKLWALMRDGSYRWTWAKCIKFNAPERVGQIQHCPIDLQFKCRTGLWYSETEHSFNTDGDDVIVNAGNAATPLKITITAGGTAGGDFEIDSILPVNNGVDWTGTIAATKSLVLDSEKFSILNDGVNAYSTLVVDDPFDWWMYLTPGNNQIRQISGPGAGTVTNYKWYDAWVM